MTSTKSALGNKCSDLQGKSRRRNNFDGKTGYENLPAASLPRPHLTDPVLSNSRLSRPTQPLVARENWRMAPIRLAQDQRVRRLRRADRAASQKGQDRPRAGTQWGWQGPRLIREVVPGARSGVRTTRRDGALSWVCKRRSRGTPSRPETM